MSQRIAVVMHYTDNISEYADLAYKINLKYTQEHGLPLLRATGPLQPPGWHPAWGKLKLLQQLCSAGDYEYLFWVDADAIFLPPTEIEDSARPFKNVRSLDWIVDRVEKEGKSFAFCRDFDQNELNSGVFLLRCGPVAEKLLKAALEFGSTDLCKREPYWEQNGLRKVISEDQVSYFTKHEFNWHGGFIFHLAGIDTEARIRFISIFKEYITTGQRPDRSQVDWLAPRKNFGGALSALVRNYLKPERSKLAIIMHYTEDRRHYADTAYRINLRLSTESKIELLCFIGSCYYPTGWHPSWGALSVLRGTMMENRHDSLLWIAADAVLPPKVEQLYESLKSYDTAVGSGFIFVKSNPKGSEFINALIQWRGQQEGHNPKLIEAVTAVKNTPIFDLKEVHRFNLAEGCRGPVLNSLANLIETGRRGTLDCCPLSSQHQIPFSKFRQSRVALVMSFTDNITEYSELAVQINRLYADQHGLHLVVKRGGHQPAGWHPAWGKLVVMLELLKEGGYDHLLWVDSDAVFLPSLNITPGESPFQHSRSPQELIERLERENRHIAICDDISTDIPLNSGVFLMRSSQASIEYLQRALDFGQKDKCKTELFWEQNALVATRRDAEICYYARDEFNFFGDWVMHMAATNVECRTRSLKLLLRYILAGVRPKREEVDGVAKQPKIGYLVADVLRRYM